MRWFMDTEFDENGSTIKLISIALVNESGSQEYYQVLRDGWSPDDCDDWVRENVLPLLAGAPKATRARVAKDVADMLILEGHPRPEIWGYFADYDWVAFCQLFGKMIDLPQGMPMYCRDLKQLIDQHGLSKADMPSHEGNAHSALEDARWIRRAWHWLQPIAATRGTGAV